MNRLTCCLVSLLASSSPPPHLHAQHCLSAYGVKQAVDAKGRRASFLLCCSKMEDMDMWMAERYLPPALKEKVRRYYVEVWAQHTGEGRGGGRRARLLLLGPVWGSLICPPVACSTCVGLQQTGDGQGAAALLIHLKSSMCVSVCGGSAWRVLALYSWLG